MASNYLSRPHSLSLENAFRLLEKNEVGYLAQPKLDGIRAYWNGVYLISRNERDLAMPHISDGLKPSQMMDGELWAPGLSFSEILSARTQAPETLQLHVFDRRSPELQAKRLAPRPLPEHCFHVPYQIVTHDTLQAIHEEHLMRGYEGTILRAINRGYDDGCFFKIKPHLDFEAELLSYEGLSGEFRPLVNYSGPSATSPFRCRLRGGIFPGDKVTIICDEITQNGKPRNPRLK